MDAFLWRHRGAVLCLCRRLLPIALAVLVTVGCTVEVPARRSTQQDLPAPEALGTGRPAPSTSQAPEPSPAPPAGAARASEDDASAAGGSNEAVAAGGFDRIPELVRQVQPSLVAIVTDSGQGSGVIWNAEGIVVTNNHVVAGARQVQVAFADGDRASARVLATDPRTDLAVVAAERDGLPAATFAEGLPEVGELALAIGNPLGFENSVTAGIISGLNRAIPGAVAAGESALVDLIQTDAAISPGNSGGALVNASGEVVGVNVAYIPPQQGSVSLGFAIPAPTVVYVVEQLLAAGVVRHPYLGVELEQLTPEIAARFAIDADAGALLVALEPGSPADRAGLAPGDLIVALDERPTAEVEDLLGALRRHKPGDVVTLTVLRGGERSNIDVELGERPD